MRRIILKLAATAAAAALIAWALPCNHYYPSTARVVEISGNYVFLLDGAGHRWSMSGREDWSVGDLASLIMYDRMTPSVYDDVIVSAQYSGMQYQEPQPISRVFIPSKFQH